MRSSPASRWLPRRSYLLKAEYLDVDRLLDDPDGPTLLTPGSWSHPDPGLRYPPDAGASGGDLRRLAILAPRAGTEPAAMRLAIANWLAYYEMPPANRPKADPHGWWFDVFYPFGPEAPANARMLSPRSLAGWLVPPSTPTSCSGAGAGPESG